MLSKGKGPSFHLFRVFIFCTTKEENFTMKLKKIASLMLAGIMAVSMLAGCGDNGGSSSTPNEPTEPTVTGYSADLKAHLLEAARMNVNAVESDALNKALLNAVDFVAEDRIATIYDAGAWTTATYVHNAADGSLQNAANDLIDALDTDNLVGTLGGGIADAFDVLDPTNDNCDEKEISMVILFAASKKGNIDVVLNEVANLINSNVMGLDDDFEATADAGDVHDGDQFDYDYDMSVSAHTKSLTGDHNKGMTFVAVQITRNMV